MNIKEIKSKDNEIIKKINSLKTGKGRAMHKEFMAEGKLSLEAGLSSNYELSFAVCSLSFFGEHKQELTAINELVVVPDRLFTSISDAQTPQGIMGIFKIPNENFCAKKVNGCLIYCDNLRDPGNIGTIIRTADAFGMDGVILSNGCCDVYMPKLVRSAMGSLFHTKVYCEASKETLSALKNEGFQLVSTALHAKSVSLYDFVIPKKTVFIIGNEAHGVSEEILVISDAFVKIPMRGFAESLNAVVAAAIVMNEVSRNRGGYVK